MTERPRDAAGRPLPPGAAGVDPVADVPRSPHESLAEAERLVAAGRPFAAHEVLEAAWRTAPAAERDLWRGLTQLAVGLTHLQRGNPVGGQRLLLRGARLLDPWAAGRPYGLDVAAVVAWAEAVAAAPAAAVAAEAGSPRRQAQGPVGTCSAALRPSAAAAETAPTESA